MTLERTVMREQIKELIISRILDFTYQPGDRVVENRLAQELNVSQAPVREALRDVEAMRLIESEPFRGAKVRAITAEELAETYPVRAALEALAGELAAPRVDETLLKQLEDEIQSMLTAANSNDKHGLLAHDARFHELIVETTGNAVLLDSWSNLRIESFTLISVITSELDLVAIANAHLPILDALYQQDTTLTAKILYEHIQHFGKALTGKKGHA